nr:lytic transglycosylase domain-containing protein [Bradyrhizobium sp. 33ap4]
MPCWCFRSAISLFDQLRDHSSVPTRDRGAVARSGGPGGPNGRREAASPWTGASTTACLHLSGACFRPVRTLLFALTVWSCAALAAEQSTVQSANHHGDNAFAPFIAEASQRFAVPVCWIRSIIRLESAGDVRAKSPKGAMGLMQIMPGTWADLSHRYSLGNDPYDARDNILAGTGYLHELSDRYGMPGAFAAYNAGPARYEKHLAGVSLPAETQAYVTNLASLLGIRYASGRSGGQFSWTAAPFFVARSERNSIPDRRQAGFVASSALASSGAGVLSSMIPRGTGLFIAKSEAGDMR